MDSAWSDKALKLDHNHGINNGKMVDLTLKLGQPVSEDDCPSGYQGNEYKQGTKWSRGMSDIIKNKQKVTNPNSDISRKSSTNYKMDITKAYSDGNSNNMVSAEFVVGIPSHHHPSNYHFHGSFSHIPAAGGSLPPSHNIHYTYNCNKICKEDNALPPPPPPPENVDKGKNSSKRGIDSGKRCMNIACSTIDTPMWRKGPLGPKTLCNACGIRYRKEKDQRKAREAGIYNYINTWGGFK